MDGGQICTTGGIGKLQAIGPFNLDDFGSQPVTVDSVTLTDNHGLAMGRPYLAPIPKDGDLIGMWYWPPYGWAWSHRVPADGAVVKPHQNLNLVFAGWRTTARAGTSNVTVGYSSGGNSYSLTFSFSIEIAASCP
jgi:hypothetical protein